MTKIIPVILSGGSGTRLWPLSKKATPKQFLRLMDHYTLLQRTVKRTVDILGEVNCEYIIVTLESMRDETLSQIQEISVSARHHLLLEPEARNTAAAVAFAINYIQKTFDDDVLVWVLPADHYIGDEAALKEALEKACHAAEDGHLVTFGIEPTRAETGYGYIRMERALNGSGSYHVNKFFEKPDRDTALRFVKSGKYLWSSGMHLFKASAGRENFYEHAPETWYLVNEAMRTPIDPRRPVPQFYARIDKQPFETAVIEKSSGVAVVPCDPKWTDIGCWESLWEVKHKDGAGNAMDGNAVCHDTRNSMIMAQDRLVTCVGLDNIIVVDTGDSILIADKNNPDSLKAMVQNLQQAQITKFPTPVQELPRSSLAA